MAKRKLPAHLEKHKWPKKGTPEHAKRMMDNAPTAVATRRASAGGNADPHYLANGFRPNTKSAVVQVANPPQFVDTSVQVSSTVMRDGDRLSFNAGGIDRKKKQKSKSGFESLMTDRNTAPQGTMESGQDACLLGGSNKGGRIGHGR